MPIRNAMRHRDVSGLARQLMQLREKEMNQECPRTFGAENVALGLKSLATVAEFPRHLNGGISAKPSASTRTKSPLFF
jgi:hypothetical protein